MSKRVKIVYGANENNFPSIASDATIGDLLSEFGYVLQIPDGAQAVVNGREVPTNYTIIDGETVTFRKKTGDKG